MAYKTRDIKYDELNIEAYHLHGDVQPFPDHFHDFYVVGFIYEGERFLCCKQKEYHLHKKDIVVFNPHDIHCCAQDGHQKLDYRAINIPIATMRELIKELDQENKLPTFHNNVIQNEEVYFYLKNLHKMIMEESHEFEKEECLLLMLSTLMELNASLPYQSQSICSDAVNRVCKYMEKNYKNRIKLDELCTLINVSKSTLLRFFIKEIGLTPYRYLGSIRIAKAKTLIEQGLPISEVALQTGFCDQSHFTNYFTSLLGLTPALYQKRFEDIQNEK